jgi:hypothetical protein
VYLEGKPCSLIDMVFFMVLAIVSGLFFPFEVVSGDPVPVTGDFVLKP